MLIKNFTENQFIRAYNSFANSESQFYLNDEEFYIYSMLFTNQMMDGSVRTSIDIIHQVTPITFIQNDTKNKNKIKKLISSLVKKNVIIDENKLSEIKNNSLLELSINNLELSNDGVDDDKKVTDEGKYKNFSRIPYTKFLEFKSTKDYYIYYVVSRWSSGFNCSYSRWADILGLKHQESAIRVIEDVVKREIIFKNIGDYNARTNQDVNIYSVKPIVEASKSKQTIKKEQKQARENIQDKLDQVAHSSEYEKDLHDVMYFFKNFNDEDGNALFPDSTHYLMYLKVKDDIKNRKSSKLESDFIKTAEKRMGYLKNNPQFKKEFGEAEWDFKKDKKEQTKRDIETYKNAIRLKDNSVVEITKDNIDSVNWKDVRTLFMGDDHLIQEGKMEAFQPTERIDGIKEVYKHEPHLIESGWELYKDIVKSGQMLSCDMLNEMRRVNGTNDTPNFTKQVDSYDAIELMNDSISTPKKVTKLPDASEVF